MGRQEARPFHRVIGLSSPSFILAVFSDVHGNLPALEAVAGDIEAIRPDAVSHAGDIVNGPSSRDVVSLVRANGWSGVMGNHEDYVLRYDAPRAPALWKSERFAPVHWVRSQLSADDLCWLGRLPITCLPHTDVTVVHGSRDSFRSALRVEMNDAQVEEMYSDSPSAGVACGHTHLPCVRRVGKRLFANAGSAGITLDGDKRASYALFSLVRGDWRCEIRRVPYDTGRTLQFARQTGWLAEGGGIAASMTHEMTTAVSWTTPFVRWWSAHCPDRTSVDAYRRFAALRGVVPLV